jgi:hypothetical protein
MGVVYAALQSANLFMSLCVIFVLHPISHDGSCFHFWVGLWMLSTFATLWTIMNQLAHTKFATIAAVFHNLVELNLGLCSVESLNLVDRPGIISLVVSIAFVGQTHLLVHPSINQQISLVILISDMMHCVAFVFILAAATTNESFHHWWIVGAMFTHHIYDVLI